MSEHDGRHDFDFLHERWHIRNKRLVGRFEGNRGDFYGDEVIDGREIKVRFVWLGVDTAQPTGRQAFSADGGQSREINWRMTFTKVGTA